MAMSGAERQARYYGKQRLAAAREAEELAALAVSVA
jgi:hypothetical protein